MCLTPFNAFNDAYSKKQYRSRKLSLLLSRQDIKNNVRICNINKRRQYNPIVRNNIGKKVRLSSSLYILIS